MILATIVHDDNAYMSLYGCNIGALEREIWN